MSENNQNNSTPIVETKKCKHCQSDIPKKAKVCPICKKKQSGKLKWIIIVIVILILIGSFGGNDDSEQNSNSNSNTSSTNETVKPENKKETETKVEKKEIYNVGDVFENKYIKMTYLNSYEFEDYNQYNAPQDGNIIICAEFEFENIGNSDQYISYVDFNGYADGYEVEQSYAPDGTGLNFSLDLSAGRKGKGIIAFEVPENSTEIQIEFSPNMWSSEKVVFSYR